MSERATRVSWGPKSSPGTSTRKVSTWERSEYTESRGRKGQRRLIPKIIVGQPRLVCRRELSTADLRCHWGLQSLGLRTLRTLMLARMRGGSELYEYLRGGGFAGTVAIAEAVQLDSRAFHSTFFPFNSAPP